MINTLIKLAQDLDSLGFHKEADQIDSKIQKISAYIHGETGEEEGVVVEDSPLSEEQIFRRKGPGYKSELSKQEMLDTKTYFVLESVPNPNLPTEEDELADEDDELLNEVWRIHSGYDTREEAKAAATNLYDETGVDFKPASKEVVTRGLEVGIIIL
jgi:hypothetical protein